MEFSKISLHCPSHPRETVTRITMDPTMSKQVYCIECLMDLEGWDREKIIPISDFIENAATSYEKMGSITKKGDLSHKYQKTFDRRFEKISDLKAHLQNEKQKIKKEFESIIAEFTKYLEEKRDHYCECLDQQLNTFEHNYTYFENSLKKVSGHGTYPSKQELVEKINRCSKADELVALIRDINEDLTSNKNISDSDDLFEKINEKLEKSIKIVPLLMPDEKFDMAPFKENLLKSWNFYLESIFTLRDNFENLSTTYPDSEILQPEDFALLEKWLPTNKKSKKFKLLYQASKNGKTPSDMNNRVFGHENTYFIYKTTGNKIFGGFMPEDFGKYPDYFSANGTFLFSIDEKAKYEGLLNRSHGWCDSSTYGCCFAKDLYISMSYMSGTTNEPKSYAYPDAYTLSGGTSWQCSEIEVYTVE